MQTSRAMTHDESVYPEPFAFKPERFLEKNGGLKEDDRILAYGFGRRYLSSFKSVILFLRQDRICVGKHSASATVGIHQVLWV